MNDDMYNFVYGSADQEKETDKIVLNQWADFCSLDVDSIKKEVDNINNVLKKLEKEVNDQKLAGIALYNYSYSSVDNLLMIQTSLMQSMIMLEEKNCINTEIIEELTKAKWYNKITLNQKTKIINQATIKAVQEYAPIRERRMKIIEEITSGIKNRKEKKQNDRKI